MEEEKQATEEAELEAKRQAIIEEAKERDRITNEKLEADRKAIADRQAAEELRIETKRKRLDDEAKEKQETLEKERREMEAEKFRLQAVKDAKKKAEREQEEAAAEAERQRIEAQKAKEEEEAQKPDRDKLMSVADAMARYDIPIMQTGKMHKIAKEVKKMQMGIHHYITESL